MRVTGAATLLELRGVSVGYGGTPVLRSIDLRVTGGEVVAVLGPNGSGKSTLLKGMLGLARVTEGERELFGVPAARFGDWHRLGYVPQRMAASGVLPASVREVVMSGRLSRMRRFLPARPADRAAAAAALERVDLAGFEERAMATLSGGQQRRVLVARALAGEPEVLLLDEPLAGVDAGSQEILATTLEALIGSGSTVVLVAHELGPLQPLITRVVAMRDGHVSYDGPLGGAPMGAEDPDAHCLPDELPSRLRL